MPPEPAPETAPTADGLRSVPDLTQRLVDAIAPFVRYDDGRLALSFSATRPHVAHAAAAAWPALLPGRLHVDDGFVTLRARVRAKDATPADAWAELLDGLLGHVKRAREAAPETRLEGGVLVWERPLHRCEVLVVLERCLGRGLRGEIPLRVHDDRVVLDLEDQHDPRWETTGGPGVFDPWPFAVWLARRHVKLQRPALRIAIEPERATPAAKPRSRATGATTRKAPARKGATKAPAVAPKRAATRTAKAKAKPA